MPEMKRRGFLKILAGAPIAAPAILKGQDLSKVEVIADPVDIRYHPAVVGFTCSAYYEGEGIEPFKEIKSG